MYKKLFNRDLQIENFRSNRITNHGWSFLLNSERGLWYDGRCGWFHNLESACQIRIESRRFEGPYYSRLCPYLNQNPSHATCCLLPHSNPIVWATTSPSPVPPLPQYTQSLNVCCYKTDSTHSQNKSHTPDFGPCCELTKFLELTPDHLFRILS